MAKKNSLEKSMAAQLRQTVRLAVDTLFEKAKARLLGRFYTGPRIVFQIVRDFGLEETLEAAHKHAAYMGTGFGTEIDREILETQAEETESIIDALKTKTFKEVFHAAKLGDTNKIKDTFKSIESHMDMIVATEARKAQSLGEEDAIMQVASSKGIEDPTIFWIGKLDGKTCNHCLAMYHTQSNPKVPRTWKMSQLEQGYFKPKEWGGDNVFRNAHPRCRHSMSILMPGFGFDDNGKVQYIEPNHDEYEKQKQNGDT
jgi:superfamily I DNA/RNA helicase